MAFADKVITKCRVKHYCDECRRPIDVGNSYVIQSGTWEGDFFADKICTRCSNAMKWLLARGHGWRRGSVIKDVRYCVEDELQKKAAAAE